MNSKIAALTAISGILWIAAHADPPPAAAQTTAPTGNDSVMALNESDRLIFMTLATASAGYPCKPTQSTFKGIYQDDGYHLVECAAGTAYLVKVPSAVDANIIVLDCAIAEAVGVDCFAKWD